jgi:hypothetical protein
VLHVCMSACLRWCVSALLTWRLSTRRCRS